MNCEFKNVFDSVLVTFTSKLLKNFVDELTKQSVNKHKLRQNS